MSSTLASARAKVLQIADQIGDIEREMNAIRNAVRAGRDHDPARFMALSCQHTAAYRSLRGAKGAVTRLMNRGVEA